MDLRQHGSAHDSALPEEPAHLSPQEWTIRIQELARLSKLCEQAKEDHYERPISVGAA